VVGRTGNIDTIWTNARRAGARLDKAVQWDVNEEDKFILKADAVTLEPRHKRLTAVTIRMVLRKRMDEKLQSLPSQGKAMKLVSKSKASSHFIRNGTRFVDWRFVHRARVNLLPTIGKPWKDETKCRRCDFEFESLAHLLNHCPPALTNIQKRHDDIVRRIKSVVGNRSTGCELLYENRTIPGTPPEHRRRRPDPVIKKGNRIHVVDVAIPFEHGEDAFKEARQRKKDKYEYTKALLRKGRIRSVTVDAFIIGSRGPQQRGCAETLHFQI